MKRYVLLLLTVTVGILIANAQIVNVKEANGKWGFVDANGNWVVKPIYARASWLWNKGVGTFQLRKTDKTEGMLNEKGEIVFPQGKYESIGEYHPYPRPYIGIIEENKGCGVATTDGKVIIPCRFGEIWFFHKKAIQVSAVRRDDVWGAWSYDGRELVPCKYRYVTAQDNCLIVCDTERKIYGVYDYNGNMVVPYTYEDVQWAADNIYLIKKNGKYGYYAQGREIIPCIYDDAKPFTNDVAMVKQDGEVKMLKNPLKNAAQIQVREPVVASKDKKKAKGPAVSRYPKPDSDVDKYIPVAKKQAETTFAFIICNENYPDAPVPYWLNDGRMFRDYCPKTLGIPENHINLYEDATFGNIITAVEKMKSIAEAYDGEASVIFYYAGHGYPDDKQATAYLLPIDGDATSITSTGYSLAKLYKEMASLKLKSAVVFLDACFSGAKREDEMLTSARGVALKVKEDKPQGNMLVFSAAQGDETAHQLEEKHHGLFTYCLLKELQASQGEVDLGTLTDNVTKQVKRQSVVINNKRQTPSAIPSPSLQASWRSMKLK